ncbi:MAG: bifunctional 5,10-methylenetetrahydrofolate dehydrogenase/5,10-methenyltetrahydrofolate cyclohydrolase [Candidatus Moranbacteria bacterium]|nr:bifunctional 5,10-methylenetetrahydrofolate dehydrogenase/5,10-methenyltetrahydrofolate cyclohydrolase [Candidatus Moranbacteria bacterium]
MQILEGKKIAEAILLEVKNKITADQAHPQLGVVLVGADEASKIYVNLKGKAAEKNGIGFRKIEMADTVSEKDLLDAIYDLNADETISGIIVQLPLPEHLDKNKIIQAIDPKKDVDGFHSENIALFFSGQERFAPVFPNALMELLKSTGKNLANKKAVIICNSQEFGQTMQVALQKENITSQYFFRADMSENINVIKDADIIITACGEPNLISGEMLKDGVIIIDGGITKVGDKVLGDVDFASVQNMDGFISPVPGGVGPVTIACLLRNVYLANKAL